MHQDRSAQSCWQDSKMKFPFEFEGLKEIQKDFYGHLAAALIDNKYDQVCGRIRQHDAGSPEDSFDSSLIDTCTAGEPRSGIDVHLSPTNHRRKKKWGMEIANIFQGICAVFQAKAIYQCSICIDSQPSSDEAWLCTKTGKLCFPQHMSDKHSPE